MLTTTEQAGLQLEFEGDVADGSVGGPWQDTESNDQGSFGGNRTVEPDCSGSSN